MSEGSEEYNYDFEALPEALRSNFAETDKHPLTPVQVEAANKLLTYFDQEDNVDHGCVLVLPAGKAGEVVPLIPYILRSHSAMLLVTTPKAVKEYTTAATGPDAMLIKQGVLRADTFAHPKVIELKSLYDIEDVTGREKATDCDLAIANITKMYQPISEIEDIGKTDETEEAKLKRRKAYVIAPPMNLPVDNIDLLMIDSAVRLAGNVEHPDYLPALEYEVRQINPDLRIVYVASRCTTRNDAIKIMGHIRPEDVSEEDDPDGISAAEAENRLVVCCDSLPKPRFRTKKTKTAEVADDDRAAKRTKEEEDDDFIVPDEEINDAQSAITHHSVSMF
jgi:hypothetical protein